MHGVPDAVAIVALTERGLVTARRIRSGLTGARIHGYAPRVPDADVLFDEIRTELRKLYAESVPIVGVCAAGILIRILAPSLADKREEPAVIAVAEDGSAVVPLLGGHRGANELGRRLGEALAAPVAITTASETRWRVALDGPPPDGCSGTRITTSRSWLDCWRESPVVWTGRPSGSSAPASRSNRMRR